MTAPRPSHPNPRGRIIGEYQLDRRIGKGAFATVYQAHHVDTNELVAIKSIDLNFLMKNEKHFANLQSEIDIMYKCKHENIVNLLHHIRGKQHIYLILQYCGGGDLSQYIQKRRKLREDLAKRFARQLAEGLRFLHSEGVIHRDLKPQNLLLSDDTEDAILQIADFGFARYMTQFDMANTLCGSPLYMAPEILQSQQYTIKVDLWSAGTIIYQMVTGKSPFRGSSPFELLNNIKKMKPTYPRNLSPECQDLLRGLLQRNPRDRIEFDEFFSHPWLTGQPRDPSDRPSRRDELHRLPSPENLLMGEPFVIIEENEPLSGEGSNPSGQSVSHDSSQSSHPSSGIGASSSIPEDSESVFSQLRRTHEFATCISLVADMRVQKNKLGEALVVYLCGLNLLRNMHEQIVHWFEKCKFITIRIRESSELNKSQNDDDVQEEKVNPHDRVNFPLTDYAKYFEIVSHGLEANPDLMDLASQFLELLESTLKEHSKMLGRCRAIRSLIETDVLSFQLMNPNAREIIYRHALDIAKSGAVDVTVKSRESAKVKLKQALCLFQFLSSSVTVDRISLSRRFLDRVINETEKRLNLLGES